VWVSVAVLLVVVGVMVARLVPLFGSMQDRIDAINGVMREQITGIRVIRAFVREKFETRGSRTPTRPWPGCPSASAGCSC
jgi:ATP-binding cassette subfamily B multidrug efflux pump